MITEPTPLQRLQDSLFDEKKVEVYIKRDDLTHPAIQGNKWRKLKYNLLEARLHKINVLLTFGGAYSNHIYATAAAGKLFHFRTIGIIRGEESVMLSPTLKFAEEQGMELHYMDREQYKLKDDTTNLESLRVQIGDFYHLPEGGTNLLALYGVGEMVEEITEPFDVICAAVGTGGTLAGIIAALHGEKKVLGFPVLKGEDTLTGTIQDLLQSYTGQQFDNWELNWDYVFGGYAKSTQVLLDFIKDFHLLHNIQLDFVYTGKLLYGVYDLIRKGYFKVGTRIVVIHTGGLQNQLSF